MRKILETHQFRGIPEVRFHLAKKYIRPGANIRFGLGAGCISAGNPTPTHAPTLAAVIYTETNAAAAGNGTSVNASVAYTRGTAGSLTSLGSFPTTGNGEGLPTTPGAMPFPIGGASGAATLSPDGTRLMPGITRATTLQFALTAFPNHHQPYRWSEALTLGVVTGVDMTRAERRIPAAT